MTELQQSSRRSFLKTTLLAGAGIAAGGYFPCRIAANSADTKVMGRVSLTAGDDRAANIFDGLQVFKEDIRQAIGNRRIVLKPNNVSFNNPLACTHVDTLEAILEFLKSIGKNRVTIAESPSAGSAFEGYEALGYMNLAKKYNIEFLDIDKEPYEVLYVISDEDFHPHATRLSSLLLNRDHFIISPAVMKTHDRVIATLSLKNIVFGAPIKDEGFHWGIDPSSGIRSDKIITHGGSSRGVNYNLFALAPRLRPDLAIVDGFQGMEGNGPSSGDPVDHRVALVGMDWLAVDRVGIELMGIDFAKMGYLNYCTEAGMGVGDFSRIEVIGEPVADHVKSYRLHDNVEKQLNWLKPMQG
ncbi:MAG TPA: DUF362 domain-containing protein [bacterium]|nr:DUF362 domain-containing protein [bacterium]HQL61307.1 DUF362 domain-containing protein [bacterium]